MFFVFQIFFYNNIFLQMEEIEYQYIFVDNILSVKLIKGYMCYKEKEKNS